MIRNSCRSMQSRILFLIVPSVLLLAAGCTPVALHPIATADQCVSDSGLIGMWTTGEREVTFRVDPWDGRTYRIAFIDTNGNNSYAKAFLTDIGGARFLDISPISSDLSRLPFLLPMVVPVHQFLRFERHGDSLFASNMNLQWFEGYYPSVKNLPVGNVEGLLVLKSSTDALRGFLAATMNMPGVYLDPMILTRCAVWPELKNIPHGSITVRNR